MGSLEVPLLERNHHLRNTSCSSHCHYTLDFLLFWWSAVYIDFTGVKTASYWFCPHGPTSAQNLLPGQAPRQSQCCCFFTFSVVLLTRFLRKESESKSQPAVPSSPCAEKRGEIHPNPSFGALACRAPGIKIPLTKPTLLNFEACFPLCLWSKQNVSRVS